MGSSVRSGALWLLGSNAGGQIVSFAFGVVLARLLVPADFGLLVTVQIFTGLANLLAAGGMGQALIRAKTADIHDYHVVFTLQLAVCISLYLFIFIASPWVAELFDEPLYTDLLRVSALNFLLRPFMGMARASLQREMNFRPIAIITVASMFFSGTVSVAMAWSGMGVWSLVLGGLAGAVLSIPVLLYITGTEIIGFAFDIKTAKQHGSFGIKYSMNEIVAFLRYQTGNFIISRFLGASSVGLYNKADSLAKMPFSTVGGAVYDPVLRAMAKVQDDIAHTRYLYFRSIFILTLYSLPVYVGIAWLAEPFILVVYGEKWLDSALPLTILSLAYSFYCFSHPSGAVFAALNKLGIELRLQSEVWILMVIACLIGLQWGIVGVACAMISVQLYQAVRLTAKVLGIVGGNLKQLFAAMLPGISLNLLMILSMALTHIMILGTTRADSPAIYLLGMSLTGAAVYVTAFLYMPITALESESSLWKSKLHLS